MSNNIIVVDHPLVTHKLSLLRDVATPTSVYYKVTKEVAALLAYRLFEALPTRETRVQTPLEIMNTKMLRDYDPAIVSILRAGNGFLDGLRDLVPTAKIGFVGMARDAKTHLPSEYYCNFPSDLDKRPVFLVDPMLATGGSAIGAVDKLKEHGATDIRFLCLLAAPEGVAAFHAAHPDVTIVTAALDRELNENKYILPGLGDAGDRFYGTTPKLSK